LLVAPAAAQTRPSSETIGTWVLSCPAAACELRYQNWIVPPGTSLPGVALEVMKRGDQFVPVVAVRGLSLQAALGGIVALQIGLRFDNATRLGLTCSLAGSDVACAPEGTAAALAAEQLPAAHSVAIQVAFPAAAGFPEQSWTLDLRRTAEALSRFRSTAPVGESAPSIPGLDWRGLLNRVLPATPR
jgi:hypothetical protein